MTDTLTHARTLTQPIAWAVASGHCSVVASDTRPGLEHVGRLIGIHAGLKPHPDYGTTQLAWDRQRVGIPRPEDGEWETGALIGVARLVGIVARKGPWESREERSLAFVHGKGSIYTSLPTRLSERIRPWWRGPWGWLLDEAVLLPEPIPMRGQQGLWRIKAAFPAGEEEDPIHDARPGENAARRALEQWRKARETR